jgi:type III secretion protein V
MRRYLRLLWTGDVRVSFTRYSDVALATLIVVIVGMMIVPLPTFFLDLLISLNLAAAVTMLLVSVYVGDALKIATFPTLLLITTLFRLAIEVSATRLILLKANAGSVIRAFGNFVVASNLVVGVVVFTILTMIQFIVIAKGAGRIAEVGARFTLDAMPGKQMAIDAELRAGDIDHCEATRRRSLLNRESQFFGAMDGAMKFVKGDAVAGILVLFVNVVGGLVIGVAQKGMELGPALRTYTLLTVGEGLVAQIPALLISTAAGIIVTRVSSDERDGHLGRDIGRQILAEPEALAVAAALLIVLALVPGLPTAPFLALGALLGFVAYRLLKLDRAARGPDGRMASDEAHLPSTAPEPIAIALSTTLTNELLPKSPSKLDSTPDFASQLATLREGFFRETGIVIPDIALHGNAPDLAPGTYAIRLDEIPLAKGMASAQAQSPTVPAGAKVIAEVIVEHLRQLLHRHAHRFVGIQETHRLLDDLARSHPALVREVVPKWVTPTVLADVLHRLAQEGVSLRNLRDILGALAKRPTGEDDAALLTEHVRAALCRQLTFQHSDQNGTLAVFVLDGMIEDTVREAVQSTGAGGTLALEPDLARDIVATVGRHIASLAAPVILTAGDIRRHVRALLATEHPHVAVLAPHELTPETPLQNLGSIAL